MHFTDIFIRRPVLATVVSLMILVVGLRSGESLSVRQFPFTENAVITVATTYYGADPDVVAGFITTPLENAIAQTVGIDYMTSQSTSGSSTITVNLVLNYDSDKALTEINTKVQSVLNQLPPGTQQPVLSIRIGQSVDSMYFGFTSDVMKLNQITDYLTRIVQPKLQAVQGVQVAEILGAKNYALRAWLDPQKLAAYGLTASQVSQAMTGNDYISGVGNTKGQMVQVNLNASTNLHSLEEFQNLVLKQSGSAMVRLKDVARVELGNDDYEVGNNLFGHDSVFIGIQVAPAANLLEVLKGCRQAYESIRPDFPQGLNSTIGYDSSDFVNSAIAEVERTLIEAALIVTVVVFAFLGSLRSILIPAVTIPLSLVGTLIMMLAFGFSINLLTLLALVLAIGLVVDDAIIVVENVNRHIDEGMKPIPAAILAARELGGPIIAMTVVLAAVYVPIGFQGGLTGALFTEFAFTLVGAVTVSAVIALTLSPMMCSRMLKPREDGQHGWQERLIDFIDDRFDRLRNAYERLLGSALKTLSVFAVFAVIVFGSLVGLYLMSKTELAPNEDQGLIGNLATPAPNATLDQKQIYAREMYDRLSAYPEDYIVFQIVSPGPFVTGMVQKPWDQRKRTTAELLPLVQKDMAGVTGFNVVSFVPPPLPGSNGALPVAFVIGTAQPFDKLYDVSQKFIQDARQSGMFIFMDNDLKIDQPQSTVKIDRDKAAALGLQMSDIGASMGSLLGGGYLNYFSLDGRSYKVIPQVQRRSRLNTDQLLDYYIPTASGTPVPLSTVATITNKTIPESLNHFQQLNEATISGVTMPGVALGDAIKFLQDLAKKDLPQGYSVDYGGQSRQYIQESGGFVVTLLFAVIVIFLSLAALFESFRDPLIILISVPMSLAGALIFIALGVGGATINLYTQVGLVTLIGLISKHGILIVEFANAQQMAGKSKLEAIELAAGIRLRPILMTTAAMVFGVVPLVVSSGAGAVSRFNLGLVIASGLSIGTLFTLFVVPAFYLMLAADHSKARLLQEKQEALEGIPPDEDL
ncbi:MAG TPA: efflux RND transporter permease subunit [Alphaproteobacteria bacterium]|jgi:multidrug efflux pump|nr:efflux RND transporter permease subunit [Alphaproteobacteria bacterium]